MMNRNLIHQVEIITPAEELDSRGNVKYNYAVPPATVITVAAWMQQDSASEISEDGRVPYVRSWRMICRLADSTNLTGKEQVRWLNAPGGVWVFNLFGPPEPAYTPRGYHHHEINLKRIDG